MEYLYVRSINHLFKIAYIWGIQSKHVEAWFTIVESSCTKPSLTIINYPLGFISGTIINILSNTCSPAKIHIYTPPPPTKTRPSYPSSVLQQVLHACWRAKASRNPFVCSEAGPSRRWKQVGESSVLNDHRIHIYIYTVQLYTYTYLYIDIYICIVVCLLEHSNGSSFSLVKFVSFPCQLASWCYDYGFYSSGFLTRILGLRIRVRPAGIWNCLVIYLDNTW